MTQSPDLVARADDLRSRRVSSRELVDHVFTVADEYDNELGVFVSRFEDEARAAAEAADRALVQGRELGPLHGIPIGVKDILATREGPTTAQSKAMDATWGERDAEVVARLRAAGAIVVGKTSTLEFASFVPDSNAPFTVPANPWDASTWPGGSSSGSGAGVAAGMMLAAVGTDTGGSIRVPASFCGITGLKPTTGIVPTKGSMPVAYSADVIGPMARSARDCAVLLEVMTGRTLPAAIGDPTGLRVGVVAVADHPDTEADPTVPVLMRDATEILASFGAVLSPVELPLYDELLNALYLSFEAERLTWHHHQLADRWGEYGVPAREGLTRGVHYSAADYVQAQRVRRHGQQLVAELFDEVDLIISPTCSRTSPPRDQIADCMRTWKQLVHAPYWSALGNPAISVPMGFGADGLPLGMQIVGRPFADHLVLHIAQAYQEATGWHRTSPDMSRPVTAASTPTPTAVRFDTDAEQLTLARQLLMRDGITEATPDEVAAVAVRMAASRDAVESLYAVDCGDEGMAIQLTFPE